MTAVVREHRRLVLDAARRVCGDDRAADVAQEVFLRVWARPERFDPERASLPTFLAMMARGVAVDIARRDARRLRRDARSLDGADDDDEASPLDVVAARRLAKALADLDPAQRQAVLAAHVEQLVHREIAQRDGIPEGTVKSRIRLGLAHLRGQLGDLRGPVPASGTSGAPGGGS